MTMDIILPIIVILWTSSVHWMTYSDEYSLNIINAKGRRQLPCADLYMSAENVQYEETDIKLIPYSCHANRGESDMLVWINEV